VSAFSVWHSALKLPPVMAGINDERHRLPVNVELGTENVAWPEVSVLAESRIVPRSLRELAAVETWTGVPTTGAPPWRTVTVT